MKPWTCDTLPFPLAIRLKNDGEQERKVIVSWDKDGVQVMGVQREFAPVADGELPAPVNHLVQFSLTYETLLNDCLQYPSSLPCGTED